MLRRGKLAQGVLEIVATPGNAQDSVAFDDGYNRVTEAFQEVETIVADSAYKSPHICKKVFDDGRVLPTAYQRPQTKKAGPAWWKYVYDEDCDCVLCPEYQPLRYTTPTGRDTGHTKATRTSARRKETIERVFAGAGKNTPCVTRSAEASPRGPNG